MVTSRTRLVAALVMGAALALPMAAQAFPGGAGPRPGGGGGCHPGGYHPGGYRPGQSWYPAAAIRSVGNQWGYNLNYYPGDGGYAAYQQGYYAALQQVQAALQQQQQRQTEPTQRRPSRPAVTPRPPRPAPAAVTPPAERAAGKLKLAQRLAEYGQPADAAEYCAAIVKQYPGTPAAAEAQAFLDRAPRGEGEGHVTDHRP